MNRTNLRKVAFFLLHFSCLLTPLIYPIYNFFTIYLVTLEVSIMVNDNTFTVIDLFSQTYSSLSRTLITLYSELATLCKLHTVHQRIKAIGLCNNDLIRTTSLGTVQNSCGSRDVLIYVSGLDRNETCPETYDASSRMYTLSVLFLSHL